MKFFLALFLSAFCFTTYAQNNSDLSAPNLTKTRNSKNFQPEILKNLSVKLSSKPYSQIFVNNKIITRREIDERMTFILKSNNNNFLSNQLHDSLFQILVDKMIEEELIRQKAQSLKFQIDKSQIDNYVEDFAQKYFKNSKNFLNFLQQNKLSLQCLTKQIEAEIIWQKIIDEVIKPTINVSSIEVKEWFEKDKIFGQNHKYLLRDYLIANSNISDQYAKKLYQELKIEKNFSKIFKKITQFSDDNIKNLAWLWASDLNPKILDKIKNLKIDEFSEPVLLDDGWHIFEQLDKKIDVNMNSKEFGYVKNQIINLKLQIAIKNYSNDLKKRAFISFE